MDIYILVCQPFRYGEFSEDINVAKCFLKGSLVCLLLASLHLIPAFWSLILYLRKTTITFKNFSSGILFGLDVFKMVVMIISKIVYSVATIRMAYYVYKGLKESIEMSGEAGAKKRRLYRRLFHFCLIPQLLNVLLLFPEILGFGNLISSAMRRNVCASTNIFSNHALLYGSRVCIFTSVTFIYYLGFLILFPTIRRAFTCQKENVE